MGRPFHFPPMSKIMVNGRFRYDSATRRVNRVTFSYGIIFRAYPRIANGRRKSLLRAMAKLSRDSIIRESEDKMYDTELVTPLESRDTGKTIWPHLPSADELKASVEKSPIADMNQAHLTQIDENFLVGREDFRTAAYVPKDTNNLPNPRSGPTYGTGIDTGSLDENTAKKMGLNTDTDLLDKIRGGFGLRGQAAQNYIDREKPTLTFGEADRLTRMATTYHLGKLIKAYESAPENTNKVKFRDLPPAAQTVIYSVYHNYGANMPNDTPNFWRDVTKQDWKATYEELMDFRDNNPTRRKAEGKYLYDAILKGR